MTTNAIEAVKEERRRQLEMWGDENHSLFEWAAILGEEYGEFCRAVNETYFEKGRYPELGGFKNISKEARHVAAVAVAIMEFLEERYGA